MGKALKARALCLLVKKMVKKMNNKIFAKIADEPFSFELFIENQKFRHV
jgi:hypothetical protein